MIRDGLLKRLNEWATSRDRRLVPDPARWTSLASESNGKKGGDARVTEFFEAPVSYDRHAHVLKMRVISVEYDPGTWEVTRDARLEREYDVRTDIPVDLYTDEDRVRAYEQRGRGAFQFGDGASLCLFPSAVFYGRVPEQYRKG